MPLFEAGDAYRKEGVKSNHYGIAYIEFSLNKTNPEISVSREQRHQDFSPISEGKVLGTRLQRHPRD